MMSTMHSVNDRVSFSRTIKGKKTSSIIKIE
jgi:hypothetical protein